MRTAHRMWLFAVAAMFAFASCSEGNRDIPTTTASMPAPSATTAQTTDATTTSQADITTPQSAPRSPEPAVEVPTEPVPYITGCQTGLGPIVTYWSDGSVTGWSDYCQAVHDDVLQAEVDANNPTCDGVTCEYSSGAVVCDPPGSGTPPCYAPGERSSAEIQTEYGCAEGYIEKSLCDQYGYPYGVGG